MSEITVSALVFLAALALGGAAIWFMYRIGYRNGYAAGYQAVKQTRERILSALIKGMG